MYLLCILFIALVVSVAAGLVRPRCCAYGHKNRYLKSLGSWTISLRKLCYDCGQGGRFGNAQGGRSRNKKLSLQLHAGNVARSIRSKYSDFTQLNAEDVLYVEVWASRRSHVSKVAAREGSWVLRICEPSALVPKTKEKPTLRRGAATTIGLDLDAAADKALLERWLPALIQDCCPERVVILTSPCCRMHSPLQHTNVAQWKLNLSTTQCRVRMSIFAKQRRSARTAILFAKRLHRIVENACTDCSGASGCVHCVHLHEQPSTARMAPLGVRADTLVGGVCPAAWTPFGDYADVAVCAVEFATTLKRYGQMLRFQMKGCTPLLSMLRKLKRRCTTADDDFQGSAVKQTAFYSKTLAYHLVIGARCY